MDEAFLTRVTDHLDVVRHLVPKVVTPGKGYATMGTLVGAVNDPEYPISRGERKEYMVVIDDEICVNGKVVPDLLVTFVGKLVLCSGRSLASSIFFIKVYVGHVFALLRSCFMDLLSS